MIVIALVWAPNHHQRKVVSSVQTVVVDGGFQLVAVVGQPGVKREGGDHLVE